MKNFYTEEEWNEILKKQEEVLKYDTFTRKQALELGLLIVVGLDLWNYMRDPENQLPLHPVSEKAGKEAA